MATVISELVNIVGFKVNKTELIVVEKTIVKLGRSLERAALKLTLGFTLPFAFLTRSLARTLSDFEQLDVAFTTMLGSAEKAKSLLDDLFALAEVTPFSIQSVTAAAKQLLAMGIESEKLVETLTNLGNVAAGLSVPIGRLALNFGQVRTRGKLTGQELRDFAIAGVPLIAELAKQLNVSEKAIVELVSAGDIGFKEVELAFKSMATGSGKFSNLMIKQSKTLGGLWSTFKDIIVLSARDMDKSLLPAFKKIVLAMIGMAKVLKAMDPDLKAFLFWVGAAAAIIPPLILIFAALARTILFVRSALVAFRLAAIAANTSMILLAAKFALIAVAVLAVIGILALIIEDILVFQRGGNSAIGLLIDKFDELKDFLKNKFGVEVPQIFEDIVKNINNAFDGVIEFLVGAFTFRFKFAFDALGKFIVSWASIIFDAVMLPFQGILDIINAVTSLNIPKLQTSEDIKQALSGLSVTALATPQFAGAGGILAGSAVNNNSRILNVNSSINLTFPVGTSQSIINTAEDQFRKAFRAEFGEIMRETAVSNPETQ